ncbi:MAG: hypothetical protein KC912_13795 [Proteobacteria bacterium]|nr:hypothetical protein [Pseudomonadota bacterium]
MPRFSRALAPTGIGLALIAVQADAVIDWHIVRSMIAEWSASERVLASTVIAGLWGHSIAAPMTLALRSDEDRWRWRVPVGGLANALGLAPVWLTAVLPLALIGWLFAHPLALPAASTVTGLALASNRRLQALAGVIAGAAVLGLAEFVPIGGFALLAGGAMGCRLVAQSPPPSGAARKTTAWRAWSPSSAIVLRDLRALWRLERGVVLGALFISAPAYAVQRAAVANFPLTGESAVRGGLLIATLALTASAAGILALPGALGPALDPRRAPLSAARRGSLLIGIGAVLAVPTVASVLHAVLAGGTGGLFRLVLHAAAMLTGAAWFAVGVGRRTDADRGSYLWWVLALGGLALTPLPFSPLGAACLALAGWLGTTWTLARARNAP